MPLGHNGEATWNGPISQAGSCASAAMGSASVWRPPAAAGWWRGGAQRAASASRR